MGGSAGGGASSPELPAYIEEIHKNLLAGYDDTTEKLPDGSSLIAKLRSDLVAGINFKEPPSTYTEQTALKGFYDNHLKPYLDKDLGIEAMLAEAESNISSKLADAAKHDLEGEIDAIFSTIRRELTYMASQVSNTSIVNAGAAVDNVALKTKSKVSDMMANFTSEVLDSASVVDPTQIKDLSEDFINSVIDKIVLFQDKLTRAVSDSIASLLNSNVVAEIIEGFIESSKLRYNQAKGRLASEAAQAGAVRSSSYTIAMAMLEIERQKSIDDFESKLKNQLLTESFALSGRGAIVSGSMTDVFRSVYAGQLDEFKVKLSGYLQTAAYIVQGFFNRIAVELGHLYSTGQALNSDVVRSYYSLYIARMEAKNRDVMTYLRTMLESEYKKVDVNTAVGKYLFDVNQFSYVTNRDYYLLDDRHTKDVLFYEYDLFQKAANVLASASGAVVNAQRVVTGEVSPIQGAMSGAAMGASIGMLFGTPGATIGAIGGGLAGLAASIFE